jgi:CTP:molybdopterin cytidylyltransferase MocA
VIDVWRAQGETAVAATYDGIRLHPVLLARTVWNGIPDEGARRIDAVLVPCDDLGPPGDVDHADEVPESLRPPQWSSPDP